MKTQSKMSTLQANLNELPFLKNLDQTQVATQIDSFRKGEKGAFNFVKLAVFGAIGWALWVYVLPTVFLALGQLLAIAATGIGIVALVLFAPLIIKVIRAGVRLGHKSLIKYKPFDQLALERVKLIQNQNVFRIAKSNVAQLKNDMEVEASRAENDANTGQTAILRLQGKSEGIKSQMDDILKEKGIQGKSEDEYVNLASDFQKTLAEAQRVSNKLTQSKEFIQKYGTRAAIMKKTGQKLVMVETAMEIKLSDFDATVEMLKKDFEFGQKANAATSAAKSALGFSKGWEFDYAMEVVTSSISADIAMTSGNLRDIESLTSNFNLDSDEMFANLNQIADKIKVGGDAIPEARKYSNPEYKLTQSDRTKSGGFGELF